jgi:HK97 family phage major capsid protein
MGTATRIRLQRLTDERQRSGQLIEDVLAAAEAEQRDLSDAENESLERYRSRVTDLDTEIEALAGDLERAGRSRDVSALIRETPPDDGGGDGGGGNGGEGGSGVVVYRTFAAYARDVLTTRYDEIASRVGSPEQATRFRAEAEERLQRAVQDTTTTTAAGLVPPQHMAQIMDIIDRTRPLVRTARSVDLTRGKLTYPKISTRPTVTVQGSEKTQGGSVAMSVTLEELNADTYIGGGDLSWQTINWSTPDALQLWFDLAAEAYARQTETAAGTALASGLGTASPVLGTAGTEDFGAWRAAVLAAVASIYDTTGGRARTDTLYLSAARFFQLAGLGTSDVVQMSAVGNLDIATMTGTFSGLRVVGSYGLTGNATILGDSQAFLVGETPGAPVQLRAVEPTIGGMEVGVIGAFAGKVYDTDRFLKLNA